jgi:hypothetical protein
MKTVKYFLCVFYFCLQLQSEILFSSINIYRVTMKTLAERDVVQGYPFLIIKGAALCP